MVYKNKIGQALISTVFSDPKRAKIKLSFLFVVRQAGEESPIGLTFIVVPSSSAKLKNKGKVVFN